ncbi:MAG: HAD family hydrolase [Sulfolobales archaeon]|nr:HAD family hydrolase [Sulfolobales archaeon]MCX8208922.1 HAD family hydrolase [Sulfolobales archaeon]MDW8011157.1 HAD family hydrolase [Sulfolobales archaeon]
MKYVVYVDLDGTLAVSPISSVIREAYEHIAEQAGCGLREVELTSWRIHIDLVRRSDPLAFDWDYIYEKVSGAFGTSPGFRIDRRFEELCGSSKVLDNAHEVLSRLRSVVRVLALATNGLLKYQKCVIELLDLSKYFDLVLTPDVVGCLKNCAKFYSTPSDGGVRIAVGDNYTFDVYYPKVFGLKTIYVARSSSDPYAEWLGIDRTVRPDIAITNLEQLLFQFYRLDSVLRFSSLYRSDSSVFLLFAGF